MAGMGEVGRLFNANELIVAEVLQSAEAMKAAVGHLEADPVHESRDPDLHVAAVRGELDGVRQQVPDDLLETGRVAADRAGPRRQVQLEVDPLRVGGGADRVGGRLGGLELGPGAVERLLVVRQFRQDGFEGALSVCDSVQLGADFALFVGIHAGALVVLGEDQAADGFRFRLPLALGGGVGIPPMIFLADQARARRARQCLAILRPYRN